MNDQDERTDDASAGLYDAATLLELHEAQALTFDELAARDGRPKTTIYRIVTKERLRRELEREHAATQAVAVAATEPAEAESDVESVAPERGLAVTPGQSVSRRMATRLYLRGTFDGRPCVVIHLSEVARAYNGVGSFTAPLVNSEFYVVPLISSGPAALGPAVRDGLMTKEEAESLDIERREDTARKVLTMLDHLARIGVVQPNPPTWHLWPVRITYADGSTGTEQAVIFLKEKIDIGFLHEIVSGAVWDMRQAAAAVPQDPRKLIDSVTVEQSLPVQSGEGTGIPWPRP